MLDLIIRNFDTIYTHSEEVRVNCPFCGDDASYHMYINPDKGVAHCFRCEWGGSVQKLLTKVLGVSWRKARRAKPLKTLRSYEEAISRLRGVANEDESASVTLPAGYIPFQKGVRPVDMIGRLALAYLRRRGFGTGTIIHYALGYGSSGQTLGRVIIPVGANYWQARTIFSNSKPKYINPSSRRDGAVFNAAALRYDPSFIAEGAFSAISLGRRALAILGKKPTRQQLDRLKEADISTYHIHLDADNEYAYPLAEELLNAGKRVAVQEYEEGDPNEGVLGKMVVISGKSFFIRKRLNELKPHG